MTKKKGILLGVISTIVVDESIKAGINIKAIIDDQKMVDRLKALNMKYYRLAEENYRKEDLDVISNKIIDLHHTIIEFQNGYTTDAILLVTFIKEIRRRDKYRKTVINPKFDEIEKMIKNIKDHGYSENFVFEVVDD